MPNYFGQPEIEDFGVASFSDKDVGGLDVAMDDAFTTTGAPVFTVRLWGTAPFQNVVVVKDNNVVYSTSGDRALSFSYQDQAAQKGKTSYYYVRGLQTDGQIVWVSPMWVTIQ